MFTKTRKHNMNSPASATSLSAGCALKPCNDAALNVAHPYRVVTPSSPCSNSLPRREYKCDAARYRLDARRAAKSPSSEEEGAEQQRVMASAATRVKNAALRGKRRRDWVIKLALAESSLHCVSFARVRMRKGC